MQQRKRYCSVCGRAFLATTCEAEKRYTIHICNEEKCKKEAWRRVRTKFRDGEENGVQKAERADK